MKSFNGIDGLTGHAEGTKQAWGAVLTIGRKHPEKVSQRIQTNFLLNNRKP